MKIPLCAEDFFYMVKRFLERAPHFYEKTTSAASLDGEITLDSTYKEKGAIAK